MYLFRSIFSSDKMLNPVVILLIILGVLVAGYYVYEYLKKKKHHHRPGKCVGAAYPQKVNGQCKCLPNASMNPGGICQCNEPYVLGKDKDGNPACLPVVTGANYGY